MIRFLLSLVVSFIALPTFAVGIDEKINNFISPATDFISKLVFFEIPIGESSMPIIIIWLLVGSIIFTFYTKFIGVWGFKHSLDILFGDKKKSHQGESGEVSAFQALATALSGTVGLGNIAGVAIAISMGGPGAMFWMVMGALIGMAAKFVECSLAVKYRKVNPDGSISGGPMYYISHGLTKKKMRGLGKFLAVTFSICCIAEAFGGGNMFQINQATRQLIHITGGEASFFAAHSWVFGLIVALIVGVIIIGGIKSIARVTEKIVPFMCILYVIAAVVVILANFTEIPAAIALIFREAFNPAAVKGGILGVIIIGLRRSIQSNEAGVGSAPIAYSAVRTKEPLSQGFVSILEPFIDTVILCALTAFTLILTGMYKGNGVEIGGAELTSQAFSTVIPGAQYFLAIAINLFALSTLISWSYYGQKAWTYLFGEGVKRVRVFQILFCIVIVIGSTMNLHSVVDFTDAMMFAMAVPNIIGIFFLLPDLKKDLDAYCKKHKIGSFAFDKAIKQIEEAEVVIDAEAVTE